MSKPSPSQIILINTKTLLDVRVEVTIDMKKYYFVGQSASVGIPNSDIGLTCVDFVNGAASLVSGTKYLIFGNLKPDNTIAFEIVDPGDAVFLKASGVHPQSLQPPMGMFAGQVVLECS